MKETNRYIRPCKDGVRYEPCPYGQLRRLKRLIPAKYAPLTFNDYTLTEDNKRAVGLSKKFCHEQKGGLYLYGAPGTGKTFLASLIARAFALDWRHVIFKNMPALLDELKGTFDDGDTQHVMESCCESDLLILDDLGAGKIGDWSVGIIYRLVNERYNANLPLVVTSNFDLKGLERRLSVEDEYAAARITSRLEEMCVQGFLGVQDRRKRP